MKSSILLTVLFNRMKNHLVTNCLFAVALLFTAGCQEGIALYPAEGLVQFENGKPVRNATIELISKDKGPGPRGRVDREGKFQLSTFKPDDGAPVGEYQVVVVQSLAPGASLAARSLGEEHKSHAGATQVVAMKHALPSTTDVKVIIEPVSMNTLQIVVEKQ